MVEMLEILIGLTIILGPPMIITSLLYGLAVWGHKQTIKKAKTNKKPVYRLDRYHLNEKF